MFDRVATFARGIRRSWRSAGPQPVLPADPWRFDPACWENLWSRAAVIHLPADEYVRRARTGQRPPARSGGAASFAMGPTGDFQGFRVYEPGDDPRSVDWPATARTRQPMVRQRQSESRRPVALVIDVSASLWVDDRLSQPKVRPIDMAFETAVWLAAAALESQSPVSLTLVSDRPEAQIQAMKGRRSIERVVRSLRDFRPEHAGTNWTSVDDLRQPPQAGSLVFWISDFTWLPDPHDFRSKFSRWSSLAVRITSHSPESPSQDTLLKDVETGRLIEPSQSLAHASITDRARRWSTLASVPLLNLPSNATRPELLLAEWLRHPLARPGANR